MPVLDPAPLFLSVLPESCGSRMFLNGFCQWVMADSCCWFTLVWLMVGSSIVFSGTQSCFVTAPRGFELCSTSLPGGNQVDGLPPAPSLDVKITVGYHGHTLPHASMHT